MDSFSLYCLATEVNRDELPRALALIEARLADDPDRSDNQLYKGALLARLGLEAADMVQARRLMTNGVRHMYAAEQTRWVGAVTRLQMLYARALTMSLLPDPPVSRSEARTELTALLRHPAFDLLHPLRRENALKMMNQFRRLHQSNADSRSIISGSSNAL